MEGDVQSIDQKLLVEAVLFMSQNAMSIEDISKATGIASSGFIKGALGELAIKYREGNTALELVEIAGKYLLSLKSAYAARVSGLANGPDISRGALRVLAYVSKNNGITQSDLVHALGSTTYEYVKELNEKEFVEWKKAGRSKKLFTTDKFREYFNT
jgi:segregation and condensation protein B